ncbi:MAG: tetratricopeptide repeat protein [Desulfobacterales bacterium]
MPMMGPAAATEILESENPRKADMMHPGDTGIRTVTMAKIYAGQGHYDLAAEIYHHLLRENPDRRDWADALAQIEAKLAVQAESRFSDPAGRLAEWIGLMLSYRRFLDLRNIRARSHKKTQEVGNER